MSTRKQMLANRQNARKSTGPKTTEGKLTVSQNAVQHGWLARNPVLPHERRDEYEHLADTIRSQYRPEPGLEASLAKRIVDCVWRLSRGPQIEAGILLQKELAHFDNGYVIAEERKNKVAKFQVEAEASHPGALGLGGACHDLLTLGRYEAHTDKCLRQAIELLERIQYARKTGIDPYYLSKIRALPAPKNLHPFVTSPEPAAAEAPVDCGSGINPETPPSHSAKQSQLLETPTPSLVSDMRKKVA